MGLRTILIILSSLIVGLCISLYFQTGQFNQGIQTINFDQFKNLQYPEEQSRTLDEFNEKIAPYELHHLIRSIHEKNRLAGEKTRVMELGPGNGRVLMQLVKLFPEIEFYGINKEKTHTFYRRESFILSALKYGIFSENEVKNLSLPYIVFVDLDFGGKIPYNDNKFDLIFSQDTMSHIKYKFELFDEILRVLKKDGISLHSDLRGVNIYSGGVVLEMKDALAEIRRRGIDIRSLDLEGSIIFKKSQKKFPLSPHQSIPTNLVTIPTELRRPDMGYNLIR